MILIQWKKYRNKVLSSGNHTIQIMGKQYKSKYNECKSGFIVMSTSHTNTGIILVPDNSPLTNDIKVRTLFSCKL